MQLFWSTPLICHYVSFYTVAEHSHLTIRNFLSCAKRQASIDIDLPADLAELLYTYLGEPRRALLDHLC